MTSDVNLNDEIDNRLEKRLPLLQDSIELKLTKELDSTLKSRFETTGKTLGLAFGLVAVVFTGLGIKTFIDIKEISRSTAIDEVKNKLSVDDPNSEFRRDIDKVMARAIVNSYLLAIAKGKQERFTPDLRISSGDLAKIKTFITDSTISTKDFKDCLEVFYYATGRQRDEQSDRLIQSMAAAENPTYSWMESQPDKRQAIFEIYQGTKLVNIAKRILSAPESNDTELITQTLKYLGDNDKGSSEIVEKFVSHNNQDVSFQALLALAKINFESKLITNAINNLKSQSDIRGYAKIANLASQVTTRDKFDFFNEDNNLPKKAKLSAELIDFIISKNIVFRLHSRIGDHSLISLSMSELNKFSYSVYVPTSLINDESRSNLISNLISNSVSDRDKLLKTIRAFCLEIDERCAGFITIILSPGASVSLKSGAVITSNDTPSGLVLKPLTPAENSDIRVSWADANEFQKSGILEGLNNPQLMSISIDTTRRLSQE